jgi:hypothetical protein
MSSNVLRVSWQGRDCDECALAASTSKEVGMCLVLVPPYIF